MKRRADKKVIKRRIKKRKFYKSVRQGVKNFLARQVSSYYGGGHVST